MNVTVRYFAAAAEAAGVEEEQLDVGGAGTLGELKAILDARYGEQMSRVLASGSFLMDEVVQRDSGTALTSRVDVLPPFAGG
ncbi:MoaD/ThiS family protein [Parafrigoribacterium soli]|uniref:MoaD/ThiS family protein n=1 Tax=Parafrigoribacterium soli TaxID=3144663 RepID=UPI0032EF1E15